MLAQPFSSHNQSSWQSIGDCANLLNGRRDAQAIWRQKHRFVPTFTDAKLRSLHRPASHVHLQKSRLHKTICCCSQAVGFVVSLEFVSRLVLFNAFHSFHTATIRSFQIHSFHIYFRSNMRFLLSDKGCQSGFGTCSGSAPS
jgi:hypothetical protein